MSEFTPRSLHGSAVIITKSEEAVAPGDAPGFDVFWKCSTDESLVEWQVPPPSPETPGMGRGGPGGGGGDTDESLVEWRVLVAAGERQVLAAAGEREEVAGAGGRTSPSCS